MTGYGSSQIKSRQLEIEVHVKSVNGRFLELRFHLPKEYAPYENDLRSVFKGWQRGTVDVYVYRRPAAGAKLQGARLNLDHATHWHRELTSLGRRLKIDTAVTLRDIVQMPFVLETQERVSLQPGEWKNLAEQVRRAKDRCEAVRGREGAVLKRELATLLKGFEAKISSMEGWRDEAMKAAHGRVRSRLDALQSESWDASRVALETALMLDKMDVHEEIVRLKEHVKACRALLSGKGPQGKKLDFYGQELLREVNTIGSKSQLATLTGLVVEAKSMVEKFREQVQNIE